MERTLALAAVFIMQGYGIYVKNNLIEPKHMKAMQVSNKTTALWLYLWFLDKITKIDEKTGLGVVLGRKPIKATDIVEVLGCNIKTARSMFKCLEDSGYIKTIRTPYGHQVYVTKAVKIFGNKERKPKSGYSLDRENQNLGTLSPKSGYSKKTIQLDKTNNISEQSSVELKANQKKDMGWNKHSDDYEEGVVDYDSGELHNPEEEAKAAERELNSKIRHNLSLVEDIRGLSFGKGKDMNYHVKIYRAMLENGWSHQRLIEEFIELINSDFWKEKKKVGQYPGMNTLQHHLRNQQPS